MSENEPGGWQYTSNPQTIWALPEELRAQAVTDMFSRLAGDYLSAVERDNPKAAQEAAAGAINVVAGLFPSRDDPAHHLIHSIVGAIVAARSGGKPRHILLRPGSRVAGTRAGYGDAMVKAFAVAAARVLVAHGRSDEDARSEIADLLWKHLKYSFRSGEHGEPKRVTQWAIRRWEEEKENNPIPAAVAPGIQASIEHDIVANGLSTLQGVSGLIADHAAEFLPIAIAY